MLRTTISSAGIACIAANMAWADINTPQVLIEVQIAEVSLEDLTKQYGVDLGGVQGLPDGVSLRGFGEVGAIGSEYGIEPGAVLNGVLGMPLGFSSFGLEMAVQALATETNTRLLAAPSIVTSLGQNAVVSFGMPVPAAAQHVSSYTFGGSAFLGEFITLNNSFLGWFMQNETLIGARLDTNIGGAEAGVSAHLIQGSGEVALSAGITKDFENFRVGGGIETISGESFVIYSKLQTEVAKVDVTITPVITGDQVEMIVDVARPISPKLEMAGSLRTSVNVPDGSTIAIGGIYKLNDQSEIVATAGYDTLDKIPFLGFAFRRTFDNTRNKTPLLVFMQPRIIQGSE